MRKLQLLGVATLAAAALSFGTMAPASAMPVAGFQSLLASAADASAGAEQVAWVCGPYGCRHVYRRPAYVYGGGPRYGYGSGTRYGYGRPYYHPHPPHHGWGRW